MHTGMLDVNVLGSAVQVIAAAMVTGIVIGATVLLAEFVKKLQLVG